MALASQFEEIHAEQSAKGTSDLCSFYSEQFLSAASLTPPVPYRIEINTVSARFRLHTPWDRALVLEYRVYLNDAPICRSVLYYDFRGRFDDIVIKRE